MWPDTINMLSAPQWLLLAAVPPAIVALYFLKLRREPLEVPSTYLWHKSIEDLHVNSIWQRLRQNLLLFLQLLLILLAMLALLRPSWQGSALSGDRFIFLVDNSASMSASDVEPTRLEAAKQQVLDLVDQMKSGDKAMVISFADGGQVVQEFSDNRRQLRRRVATIGPSQRGTSLLSALQLASGLANPGRSATDREGGVDVADPLPATLYIFSDGRFPPVEGFSLGNLEPIYVPIGIPEAANRAITAFATRRHESKADRLQAYGQVENHGLDPVETTVDLYQGRNLLDSTRVDIKPGEVRGVAFDMADLDAGVLRVELNGSDDLAVDDVAYAAVNVARRARVLLVTPGNEALEWAASTARASELADVMIAKPEILKTGQYAADAAAGNYDLVIYDQCRPAADQPLPQANTLFVGRLPAKGWDEAEQVVGPQIIDVDRAHPLMQLLVLENVEIASSLALEPPPGSAALIDSSRGTLMAVAPREGFEDAVLGFEIFGVTPEGERYANTNWPLRLSFPTFVLNVLEYLGGQTATAGGSHRPGDVVRLRSASQVDEIEVRGPGGTQKIRRGRQNLFEFSGTEQVGIYDVLEGGKVTQRFAVNLFNAAESNVAPRAEGAIQIGYTEVEATVGWEPARREAWKLLLLLALLVLLAEWYIYNRRVYI